MQLSSELFERIVGIAAPAQPAPAANDMVSPAGSRVMDRRGATRIPFGARAKITYENPEQAGLTDTVMLQDISVLGVSFVSAEWIALEEVLVVHIKDQRDQELRFRCKVQRCEQGGYGGVSYIIGTTFLELLENTAGQSEGGAAAALKKSSPRRRRAAAPPPGFSGRWKKLNPLRLFGSRNFDDFTAVGEGSKPSPEVLEQQEAEEAEEENPAQAPNSATLTDSEAVKPRKSSIFLRSEPKAQAPVQEITAPQKEEERERSEFEIEVAAIARPTETAENPSISADDIAAILGEIPIETPMMNELPTHGMPIAVDPLPPPAPVSPEPVAISASTPPPANPEPAAIESRAPVAAEPVAIDLSSPAAVENSEAAAIELPTLTQPTPVEAVKAEPEKIEVAAATSEAVKAVVAEAEQTKKLAEDAEVAEEVENAVKTAEPNSGMVKFRFTEKSLPSYLSNPDSIEDLVPWLSFSGVGVGELPAAFAHLGFEGSDATAMNILQMKDAWAEEFRAWNKRDLHGKRYVYMWADGLEIGGGADGVLIIMGAGEKGERELIAVGAGQRENPDSWIALLGELKNRGLTRPPKLFIGDAKLGLWKPLSTLSPTTRQQHCWTHKSADVLRDLPDTLHPYATAKLDEISTAARREAATKPLELFAQICGAESPAAAQGLLADKDNLLTFHDFPAEHWTHLRNTNAIDGIFNTLNLKAYSAEGAYARDQAIIMAFKLAMSAQRHWRKLGASPLLSDVLRGVAFIDGVKAAA